MVWKYYGINCWTSPCHLCTEANVSSECKFTKQLPINHDLIEVKEGWCFSVSQRKFVLNPIGDTNIGKESPRAFIEAY